MPEEDNVVETIFVLDGDVHKPGDVVVLDERVGVTPHELN
jgi:hypothetical protein